MKPDSVDTEGSLHRLQLWGYLSVFVVVVVLGSWSALTSLSGAVIAPATIVTESNSKRIQHKDGGVVREILVRNGDRVGPGQKLVVLDDTETRSELSIVDALLIELLAKKARLDAERDGSGTIVLPQAILDRQAEPEVAQTIAGQQRLFESNRATVASKKEQLAGQIDQIRQQVEGLGAQITAKDRQVALINEELVALKDLYAKGLVANSRVLAMERERARLEGERGELTAARAEAAGRIGEVQLQMLQVEEEGQNKALSELRDVEAQLAELRERRLTAASRLERMVVTSPIAGDVYELALHTVGGVVMPAETLMMIAPEDDELVLEAEVSPQSIDKLQTGQLAHVRFPAFDARLTPELTAEVTQVAADVTRPAENRPPYYAVRLRIATGELAKLEGKRLKPGMPAEAFIQTAARSPLSYLLRPLLDQINHAMRED
jgi:HlyD family secretion protein